MRRTELALEQMEDVNGGMYQGYGGVERPGIMSKGMGPGMLPRGPGMMGPSYYNTPQYIPEEPAFDTSIPPHVRMTMRYTDGKKLSPQEYAKLFHLG